MEDHSHDLVPLARLAPAVATVLILFGVWMAKAWWFWALAPLAIAGALFGVHPIDLVYNEVLAPILGKRPMVPCGPPRRLALVAATLWLVMTGFAFLKGPTLAGGLLAGLMAAATFMTATLDFCMPCGVFNALFGPRRQQRQALSMEDEPTALLP
jgi:uncharacterized protein DUF4395